MSHAYGYAFDPRDSCFRKRAYKTEKIARQVMANMVRAGEERLHVYGCGECGDWHIGHIPGSEPKTGKEVI